MKILDKENNLLLISEKIIIETKDKTITFTETNEGRDLEFEMEPTINKIEFLEGG